MKHCLLLLALAAPALAQPSPGDWIVSDTDSAGGGLRAVAPGTGALSTVASFPFPMGVNFVAMHADGADLVAGLFQDRTSSTAPLSIIVATPGGVVATIVTGPPINAADLDQDGTWRFAVGGAGPWPRLLARLDPATGLLTTIVTMPAVANALAIDQDTGDPVLGTMNALGAQGDLLRVARGSLAISTIAAGLSTITGVDFEPATGTFAVTRAAAPQVVRVAPAGAVAPLATLASANAVHVDEPTGNLVVVTGGGTLHVVDPVGNVLTTYALGARSLTGVTTWGSRTIALSGSFTAGRAAAVQFHFPSSPLRTYVAALSLGLRPGLGLGDGRTIHLAVDPLLLISLGGLPGVTTGFAGMLDAGGRAGGTITLPPGFPPGVRIFVAAVALNPSLPLGLDTGSTVGFTSN